MSTDFNLEEIMLENNALRRERDEARKLSEMLQRQVMLLLVVVADYQIVIMRINNEK